jgi:hypothetical protein
VCRWRVVLRRKASDSHSESIAGWRIWVVSTNNRAVERDEYKSGSAGRGAAKPMESVGGR